MRDDIRAFLNAHAKPEWDAKTAAFWDAPLEDAEPMLSAHGIEGCGCWECVERIISARPYPENLMYPFIVCAHCGNKRCPAAQSHVNDCTGSNKSGQPGSVRYGGER